MNLPIVDLFNPPFEKWEKRDKTIAEMLSSHNIAERFKMVNIRRLASIGNAIDAAIYIGKCGYDNEFTNFINLAIDNNKSYREWRKSMPSATPANLSRYQKFFLNCDFDSVSITIDEIGSKLSEGQFLFHGGHWPYDSNGVLLDAFSTSRPLSTSLCPLVALNNANHLGKAYDKGYIDLFVLKVINPKTKTFVYRRSGTSLGHENEVVFSSNANIYLKNIICITNDHPVGKEILKQKNIPIFLFDAEIS
ncbi:hypothetical protein [Aeromonas veronii]|uniref:hypothetical protein n=1 Tax=Aeromonas veronii TaxID=654 RepID=UPI003BA1E743